MTADPPAIEVEDVTKAYGGRRVLDGVSFSVARGSLVALLGPNGAGKTTTAEIVEGYRDHDGGRAHVLGVEPRTRGGGLRARVGVMLQGGGVYPLATPGELVHLFARFYAAPRDPDQLLDALGLDGVRDERVRTLSGGERQRLGLALALVGNPEVLILDEPTAGMDPAAKQSTRALLEQERDAGVAILLTTHELADVERLADRVVVLDRGRVVADAPPDELTGGGAVLRFRLASTLDERDEAALAAALGATLAREARGWLRLDGHSADPVAIARLATWCAERGVTIAELRAGGGPLEDRYLELVGERWAAE